MGIERAAAELLKAHGNIADIARKERRVKDGINAILTRRGQIAPEKRGKDKNFTVECAKNALKIGKKAQKSL